MSKLTQPVIAVGAVIFQDERVLLVERKHPPSQGQWAIPGGKVRLGETLQAAAEREILEETGITIRALHPIYTFELIEKDPRGEILYHYVILDLLAEYVSGQPRPADDVSAAAWIDRNTLGSLQVNQETLKLLRQQFNFASENEKAHTP
jgi:8-oxo-dGTP diphosphatase